MSHRLYIALLCAAVSLCSPAAPDDRDPTVELVARAHALRASGKLDEAQRVLQGMPSDAAPNERADALSLEGRILLARGEVSAAASMLDRAMREQHAMGDVGDALADGFALTFVAAAITGEIERGERLLDTLEGWMRPIGEDRAAIAFHRGLLAHYAAQPREALRYLEQAQAVPDSEVPDRLARRIWELHGAVLASVGRFEDAWSLASKALGRAAPESACDRSDAHGLRGWFALLPRLSYLPVDGMHGPTARTDFAEAERLAERCEDPRPLAHGLVNSALSALVEDGDHDLAHAKLARFFATDYAHDPVLWAWALEAHGRLALTELKLNDAHTTFARQLALAEASGRADWAHRARVGVGHVALLRSDYASALMHFRAADGLVTRLSALAPLSAGHDAFYAQNEDAARGVVESLLALGQPEEAERYARRALSRATAEVGLFDRAAQLGEPARRRLAALMKRHREVREELDALSREDWRLSDEALRAAAQGRKQRAEAAYALLDEAHALLTSEPQLHGIETVAPGTVVLTLYPSLSPEPSTRFRAFVRVGRRLDVFGLPAVREPSTRADAAPGASLELGAEAFRARLTDVLKKPLASASELVLHVHPALFGLDLHRARVSGRPLNTQLGVSFAHGLAPRPSSDLRSALIVVDPTRTLEHAAKEAESVAQTLRAAGLSVQLLAGAEVTRARVIAGLGKADLVHFVGHGQRQGQRALEQTLRLFDGQTLSASDLLTLRNTPAWVILSACEAGRQDSGQLSLARAFLAQGSKQVLAATRTVDDGATRLLMEEVYAHLPEVKSLPQALQFAAAKVQQTLPESDWAAFRVFVR